MVKLTPPAQDPTIDEINRLYFVKADAENLARAQRKAATPPAERYIGASSIGKECSREIYYDMVGTVQDPVRWNAGILAAEDGNRAEPMMAARLRMVSGIELYTHDETGQQYGFNWGFMRGNFDGIIRGIWQAPLTWHIWDHKRAKEEKFNKLKKLVAKDEKAALQEWNHIYYAQQVIYMDAEDLTRSYLTCSMDGGTQMTSVRTNANPKYAKALRDKAKRIKGMTEPPPRISEKPDSPNCFLCAFRKTCHNINE